MAIGGWKWADILFVSFRRYLLGLKKKPVWDRLHLQVCIRLVSCMSDPTSEDTADHVLDKMGPCFNTRCAGFSRTWALHVSQKWSSTRYPRSVSCFCFRRPNQIWRCFVQEQVGEPCGACIRVWAIVVPAFRGPTAYKQEASGDIRSVRYATYSIYVLHCPSYHKSCSWLIYGPIPTVD